MNSKRCSGSCIVCTGDCQGVEQIVFIHGFLENASAGNVYVIGKPKVVEVQNGFVSIFHEGAKRTVGDGDTDAVAFDSRMAFSINSASFRIFQFDFIKK